MPIKLGGLTISVPEGESLLLIWPDGTRTKMRSVGLIDAETLWLTMSDKENPPFLKTLGLRLNHEIEPFPGVHMTLVELNRKRVNIRAARDRVTVLRGDEIHSPSPPT